MLSDRDLDDIFDSVMRNPASHRGMDVNETARLLAEAIKGRVTADGYEAAMQQAERRYLDEFLNTCVIDPSFAARVQRAIRLYI